MSFSLALVVIFAAIFAVLYRAGLGLMGLVWVDSRRAGSHPRRAGKGSGALRRSASAVLSRWRESFRGGPSLASSVEAPFGSPRMLSAVPLPRSALQQGDSGASQRGALDALVRVHAACLRDLASPGGRCTSGASTATARRWPR